MAAIAQTVAVVDKSGKVVSTVCLLQLPAGLHRGNANVSPSPST